MLRILIVDDEPWARTELKRLLAERADVRVVGEADSVDATVDQMQQCDPDVMFLDIRLRAESGFDVFERTVVRCHVVFLTAYDDHALRAFEVDALDYLVKPIRPKHLERALCRAVERPFVAEDRVFLRESKQLRACPVSDIAFVRGAKADTEVHLTSGEVVLVRKRLRTWKGKLPSTFVRVHRSTLVNLSLVETLTFTEGRWEVRLRGVDQTLPVSRRLAQSVKAEFEAVEPSGPGRTTDDESNG